MEGMEEEAKRKKKDFWFRNMFSWRRVSDASGAPKEPTRSVRRKRGEREKG